MIFDKINLSEKKEIKKFKQDISYLDSLEKLSCLYIF